MSSVIPGRRFSIGAIAPGLVLVLVVGADPAFAQILQRVSVGQGGVSGDQASQHPSISADGRYVAFVSKSSNLVSGDTNGKWDVFVRDRVDGSTERVSTSRSGVEGNYDSGSADGGAAISADGRFVAFWSRATNLVAGDTNSRCDVFVRDRATGAIERVSVASDGAQATSDSGMDRSPSISADGRFVAFASSAANLVPGDTNNKLDVFVRDRELGTTERVSVASDGAQGNFASDVYGGQAISADGRFVLFESDATNLVPGDTNHVTDVFVRDRRTGTTERLSVSTSGVEGNGSSHLGSISPDGGFVAFSSVASNFVTVDPPDWTSDVFVRDRAAGTTEAVTDEGVNWDGLSPAISTDGRFVAYLAERYQEWEIYLRDRRTGELEHLSRTYFGERVNGPCGGPVITPDGRHVAFEAFATNLVPGDTHRGDVYLCDRQGGPDVSIACFPGVAGVLDCPCSNPPNLPDRGCDNSEGTGGASISASGGTYLTSDSLVFSIDGQIPSTTSVLVQGSVQAAHGVLHGQGVRCVEGHLLRLYTKLAPDAVLRAPDFLERDPPVSSRSAELGDVIAPGESRLYFASYRDPVALGGCFGTSLMNATPTAIVTWAP